MSSTILAVCGSSSLTHMPHLPCWANLNFDGATGKPRLAAGHGGEPLALADRVGQVLVEALVHLRLVVAQVHLRRAAVHVQVDDRFALGGKCGKPGSGGMDAGRFAGARPAQFASEHGQREAAEAQAGVAEELAAVEGN